MTPLKTMLNNERRHSVVIKVTINDLSFEEVLNKLETLL